MESDKKLFDIHTCLVGNWIAETERDKKFRILVASICETDKRLFTVKVVTRAVPHPSNITKADISHGEILGLVEDKKSLLYHTRITYARDTSVVNKYP